MENKLGVTRRIKEKTTCKYNMEYLANVTDLPQLSHNMYSQWRGLPIAADYTPVFLSFLHVHRSNMNGIEVSCRV